MRPFGSCTLSLLSISATTLFGAPSVRIISPADGAWLVPGKTITVKVEATPLAFTAVYFGGSGPFAGFDGLTEPPYQFSFSIPADCRSGAYGLTAVGVTSTQEKIVSTIMVNIERTDSPRVLDPGIESYYFDKVGDAHSMVVWGVFADGSKVDLTESKRLTYTSDRPTVAKVLPQARIKAVGIGTARITIKYGDKTVVVPLTIRK